VEARVRVLVLLVIALLALNLALVAAYASLYGEYASLRERFARAESELRILRGQLEYYIRVSGALQQAPPSSAARSLTFRAVAVRFSEEGCVGEVLNMTVSLVPGRGRVFVATNPRVGIDLQTSINVAKEVAERYANVSLEGYDVIVTVSAREEIDVVDGPSAGAVITAALIALLEGRLLNSSVFVTGTICPDGSIGRVGGIVMKAIAAAEAGGRVLLVPKGCRYDYVVTYREVFPGVYIRVGRLVDVQAYLRRLGYSIRIVEVGSIDEVLRYCLV